MPYRPAIEHSVLVAAIEAVAKTKHTYIQTLKKSEIAELRFFWINTDSGYECHDRETAKVQLVYSDALDNTRNIEVKLQMDEGKLSAATIIEDGKEEVLDLETQIR